MQIGLVLLVGAFAIIDEPHHGRHAVRVPDRTKAMVIWPVRQLGRVLTDSGKAVVSLGRVNEILNSPEETLGADAGAAAARTATSASST